MEKKESKKKASKPAVEKKKPIVKEVVFSGEHSAKGIQDSLGLDVSLTYNPLQLNVGGVTASVGDAIVSKDGVLTIKKK